MRRNKRNGKIKEKEKSKEGREKGEEEIRGGPKKEGEKRSAKEGKKKWRKKKSDRKKNWALLWIEPMAGLNRLTAIDAYMRKSGGLCKTIHKQSTVHQKKPNKICQSVDN